MQLSPKKMICAAFGEGIVNNRTCQKWFINFHGTSLLGQVVEVEGDYIKALHENNQQYMLSEANKIL